MSITINLEAFKQAVASEKEKISHATRAGAQAAAQVIYEGAKMRVPVSSRPHMFHGSHGVYGPYSPGALRDAIYQVYSKDNSGAHVATYHIAWNHQKVPYGFMVELGTSRSPARPFLLPAIIEGRAAAERAMRAKFAEKVAG